MDMTKNQKIERGNRRLLKLAKHLESGKLGHEIFDFTQYNSSNSLECGTRGCAIGECPIVFPREWYFARNGCPTLRETNVTCDGKTFFAITVYEYSCLFIPSCSGDGMHCARDATKREVAANIRNFVAARRVAMEYDNNNNSWIGEVEV
jgi:hypothetical protein